MYQIQSLSIVESSIKAEKWSLFRRKFFLFRKVISNQDSFSHFDVFKCQAKGIFNIIQLVIYKMNARQKDAIFSLLQEAQSTITLFRLEKKILQKFQKWRPKFELWYYKICYSIQINLYKQFRQTIWKKNASANESLWIVVLYVTYIHLWHKFLALSRYDYYFDVSIESAKWSRKIWNQCILWLKL